MFTPVRLQVKGLLAVAKRVEAACAAEAGGEARLLTTDLRWPGVTLQNLFAVDYCIP